MGVSKNRGTLFWGSYNKDPTISGAILGSPIFGNPYTPPGVSGGWLGHQGGGSLPTLSFGASLS